MIKIKSSLNFLPRLKYMKRVFDFVLCIASLLIFSMIIVVIALLVKLTSNGPILYWSDRVGINNTIFKMPKFRTMKVCAPEVATHLLIDVDKYLTPVGKLLRKSSLDELPQLWSILVGNMSFVGPRPALYNQRELIELRSLYGVDKILPGLTGWAQVNGRDELSIPIKVQFDEVYLHKQSFWFDIKILALTFSNVIRQVGISH